MARIILYGITIWGGTYPTYLQQIQILQNEALRVSTSSHSEAEANPADSQLKVLKIKDLYKCEVAKFVYCCVDNKAPTFFSEYFTRTNQVSSRHTRQSLSNNKLYIPRYRSNKRLRCIKCQRVKILEQIPNELKISRIFFKNRYIEFLLSSYVISK